MPGHVGEGLTAIDHEEPGVHSVVLGWLAALFAVMAALLALTAAVVGWPILLLAIPMAGVAYLFWYHASGRLTERLRQQARRGAGTGRERRQRRARATGVGDTRRAGPGGRVGSGGVGADEFGDRSRAGNRKRAGRWRQRTGPPPTDRGMSPDRARGVLGVRADADADAIRDAYREKVKETHPDRGGSTEAFKRVNEAYDALDGAPDR